METQMWGGNGAKIHVKVFSNLAETPEAACRITNEEVDAFLNVDVPARGGYIGEVKIREVSVSPIPAGGEVIFMATISLACVEWKVSSEE